jgi:hypothetical protein
MLGFCDAEKKVAANGVAQSFGHGGDEVARRRRSGGADAVELWQRRDRGATWVTGSTLGWCKEVDDFAWARARAVARRGNNKEVEDGGAMGGGVEVGQPNDANQISPRLGFHIGRVTPLIPGTFLVSVELCQSIPIMRFMVWVTSADTNKAQPINTTHTPLFWPSTTVAAATVPTEISFFDVFLQRSLICFFPFLPWYIKILILISPWYLMDLGLFPCIYILKDIGLFSCIYSNRDLDFTFIYSNSSRIIPIYPILIN